MRDQVVHHAYAAPASKRSRHPALAGKKLHQLVPPEQRLKGPGVLPGTNVGGVGTSALGNSTLHRALLGHSFRPWAHMRILIATLSASLTVTIVAFGLSSGQAQAGFCQYQYKHCGARCASKVDQD